MERDDEVVAVAVVRTTLTLNWRGKTKPVPEFVQVDSPEMLPAAVAPAGPRVLSVSPFVARSPLDICLSHWTDWMHQNDRDLSGKGQVGINSDQDHEGYDDGGAIADAAIARASREIAMATDAMIDSLHRHWKAAIYRRCNITSVWRFQNLDFVVTLPEAEEALIEKLSKNIATRIFW